MLELRGPFARDEPERAERHLDKVVVLVLAVGDVVVDVQRAFPRHKALIAKVGVVRIVEGKAQRQVIILKKIDEGVHFLRRQAVQRQVVALCVHQLGPARAQPGVRPHAAQQPLAHAGAPAPGGDGHLNAGALYGVDGVGVFARDTVIPAGAQRTVDIQKQQLVLHPCSLLAVL